MNALAGFALPEAFFLPTARGARYALFHAPVSAAHGTPLLYLHPWDEEMNATRRLVAQQARALAAQGYPVLQIDLRGCGDSEGRFEEASWEDWVADAQCGWDWRQQRTGEPPGLWAMRAGDLVASALMQRGEAPPLVLLWQPVVSGQQALQQFLRLGMASQWLGAGSPSAPAASLLAQGQAVEIAGYTLTPAMAKALASARLVPPRAANGARLIWMELSPRPDAAASPAVMQQQAAWQAAGWQVSAQVLPCPAFWRTVGLEEAPELLRATLEFLAPPRPETSA